MNYAAAFYCIAGAFSAQGLGDDCKHLPEHSLGDSYQESFPKYQAFQ